MSHPKRHSAPLSVTFGTFYNTVYQDTDTCHLSMFTSLLHTYSHCSGLTSELVELWQRYATCLSSQLHFFELQKVKQT